MSQPDFRAIATPEGTGVTYTCGCSCQPTARVQADGSAGHEHCCCGKVHFVGADANGALLSYLEERKARRKREPEYELGESTVTLEERPVAVAWAFPKEP